MTRFAHSTYIAAVFAALLLVGCDMGSALEMPETVRDTEGAEAGGQAPDAAADDAAAPDAAGAADAADAGAEPAAADAEPATDAWKLVRVKGAVTLNGEKVEQGAEVPKDGTIETGKDGYAILKIDGTSIVEIRAKSKVELGKTERAEVSLKLLLGTAWSFLDPGSKYEVVTDNAVAGVRGTVLFVQKKKGKTYVCDCQGKVQLTAIGKSKKPFDELIDSPEKGHKAYTIVTKKKKTKAKKAKLQFHTDAQAMEVAAVQAEL